MLAVGSGLSPVNCRSRVVDAFAIERHMFAITFHGELLEIGWKTFQILVVWQNRNSLGPEEITIPDGQESHQDWQVGFERRGTEMLVHRVEAGEHGAKLFGAD